MRLAHRPEESVIYPPIREHDALTAMERSANDDGEDSAAASVGDTSLKHVEIDDYAGGASRLGKSSIGSASTTAALTLHPCIYVSGAGEASEAILQQIFGQVGPCTVTVSYTHLTLPTIE